MSLYNSAVKDRHGVVRYDRSVTAYLIWQGNNNDSRGRKKKKKEIKEQKRGRRTTTVRLTSCETRRINTRAIR